MSRALIGLGLETEIKSTGEEEQVYPLQPRYQNLLGLTQRQDEWRKQEAREPIGNFSRRLYSWEWAFSNPWDINLGIHC